MDARVGAKDVGGGIGQFAGKTGASSQLQQLFLNLLAEEVFLQFAEELFFFFIAMVDITQLGIGNDQAIGRVDDIERFLSTAGQFLVGLDDGGFIVDHGIVVARGVARGLGLITLGLPLPLEKEVFEPAGTAGAAVDAAEELADLFLQLWLVEVIFSDVFRVAEQGIEKAKVGAGAGVGLRGRGHHKFEPLATDGGEDVRDFNGVAAGEAEFFRETLFYAEYDRAGKDRPGIFHFMVVVAKGNPQTAGRPYGVGNRAVGLEVEHDVDGAFVDKIDVITFLFGEFLNYRFKRFVLRAGNESEGFVAAMAGSQGKD